MIDYAYTRYDVRELNESGLTEVWTETNDDGDTGYPGEHATWRLEFPNVEAALKHTGKSRQGVGHRVFVHVNGEQV